MTLSRCHYANSTLRITAVRRKRAILRKRRVLRFQKRAKFVTQAASTVKITAAGASMKTQATALYPFVPSGKDFPKAISFMKALGFEEQWNAGGYAGLRFGGAYFILQSVDAPQWAEQQMVVFEVTDLEEYWKEIQPQDLPQKFPGTKANPPKDFAWGREIHIIDPAGVCWHVRQKA